MPHSKRALGARCAPLVVGLAFLGACDSGLPTAPVDLAPSFFVAGPGFPAGLPFACSNTDLVTQQFKLIKHGGAGTFAVEVRKIGDNSLVFEAQVTLEDGECVVVDVNDTQVESEGHVVTVTEIAGMFQSAFIETVGSVPGTVDGATVSARVSSVKGAVATFFNVPEDEAVNGRMTGGGGQLKIDGVRVTRGFTIHCDIILSNNLEINWTGGNKWHIDKPLTSALCIDDPAISPEPPPAPFDTFVGEGVGSLNGVDGSVVRFVFVDDGEPGDNDMASIRIWAPGDDPDTDTPVLEVSGFLDNGNIQAHFDQPHK